MTQDGYHDMMIKVCRVIVFQVHVHSLLFCITQYQQSEADMTDWSDYTGQNLVSQIRSKSAGQAF